MKNVIILLILSLFFISYTYPQSKNKKQDYRLEKQKEKLKQREHKRLEKRIQHKIELRNENSSISQNKARQRDQQYVSMERQVKRSGKKIEKTIAKKKEEKKKIALKAKEKISKIREIKAKNRKHHNASNKNSKLNQKDILIEFYYATDGDNWFTNTNWLSEEPISEWYGVETYGTETIYEINLPWNDLFGSIPESFTGLVDLEWLDLSSNYLYGELPSSIGNLQNLFYLSLANNLYDSELPESIWDLTGLWLLYLYDNEFYGELSPNIANLQELNSLDLSNNYLYGTLPDELWTIYSLESLFLNSNFFEGELTNNIGNLYALYELNLGDNFFEGNLPESIWSLTSLSYLDLNWNFFTGELSSDISNLQNLYSLDLSWNEFEGQLPESISQLTSLDYFSIWWNYFYGDLPSNISDLENLTYLDLSWNEYESQIPDALWQLSSLEWLYLEWNYFSGNISSNISNLENLYLIDISGNEFSGNFPSSFFELTNLESLGLGFNYFTGELPETISNMTYLGDLFLYYNNFSGTIPSNIGQLEYLYFLDLGGNNFEGEVPESILNISDLYSVYLDYNQLNSVPAAFSNSDIYDFWINDNYLTFEDIYNLPETAERFPQLDIVLDEEIILSDETPYNYQLPFDQYITNSTYTWYRNDDYFESNNIGNLEITETINGNTHYYSAIIQNSDYPGWALYTEPIKVRTYSECGYLMDLDLNGSSCENVQLFDLTTSADSEIISWSWNFDDPKSAENNFSNLQNPQHYFVGNKAEFDVELIVNDNNQCSDTLIKTVEPDYPKAVISGTVTYRTDNPISEGYVLVYLLSDGVISTKVDSVYIRSDGDTLQNGKFRTRELSTCLDYLITAYPDPNEYPGILPRWYSDAFYWYNATPISLSWDDSYINNINIDLYQYENPPTGTSTVGGGIYYLDHKGEPVKNIDVVLEYERQDEKGYEVVGYMVSDNVGKYRFNNLGLGTFKIQIDIPGLQMDSAYTVTINEPNTIITDLNYYVDLNSGISTSQTSIEEIEANSMGISIIPNPNNGQFLVEIINNTGVDNVLKQIDILSIDGMTQGTYPVEEIIKDVFDYRLNISDLKSGVYLVKLITEESQTIRKFIIK